MKAIQRNLDGLFRLRENLETVPPDRTAILYRPVGQREYETGPRLWLSFLPAPAGAPADLLSRPRF